ncbi:hypothetical protein [Corynebacterium lemuris]|uniref:hypothetical protein n=1 Tax=Corynebacterium lemuris TaxID=1859292 RepID=UPI0021764E56|nr:hypothetical protein [Corynebacterium lemuris]
MSMALWVLLWGFFLNPPKYLVIRRYEAIRRSAEILRERGLADAADENAPPTGG